MSGTIGNSEVIFVQLDRESLGAVRMTTSLFIGNTGIINMNCAAQDSLEPIEEIISHFLVCPNVTIT